MHFNNYFYSTIIATSKLESSSVKTTHFIGILKPCGSHLIINGEKPHA